MVGGKHVQADESNRARNGPSLEHADPGAQRHCRRNNPSIWIGLLEATAIATELENIQFPRPMTHDLIRALFDHLKVKVERVEVCELKNNTYYALIHIRNGEQLSYIDSRPSDAIAIALRTNAPIFVKDEVITKYLKSDEAKPSFDEKNKEQWAEILDKLDPSDFSKYKM